MKLTYPLILLFLMMLSCRKEAVITDYRLYSGGKNGTIFDESENAFGHAMSSMSNDKELLFFVGNSFFNQNWVSAPASAKARDGIGPLLNAKSCSACHFKDGRGAPILSIDDNATGFLIRLSTGNNPDGSPIDDPIYGGQFNDKSINGVKDEGVIHVNFEYTSGEFEDGTPYTLRKPIYSLIKLNYGALSPNIMMSPRIGQQMIGLGLLEAINSADILLNVDENDANGDGISGKANYVWDIESGDMQLGLFGWKAGQPSLKQQVAAAFQGDLGIKSYLFPNENHTDNQPECLNLEDGGEVEIEKDDLEKTVLYASSLAVPARRNVADEDVIQGELLFSELQCIACHTNTFETGNSHVFSYLNKQLIHPYSDMLLHDMGTELSDNRPIFLAEGKEWRTQPLWGIGLIQTVNGHTYLLHDGRARNIEEAILWHGGEAETTKNRYKALPKTQRAQVLKFINSL
ncbi:thiol oxidoreductase [Putridiphycobacter roseus]|uniref:Thiol oxidoreductase n=1 Tax=Putridiphycobacter roseus TaxID=2219161 RepID=A0A2W1MYC5_9FLAO|nr:di-heme oxidoredictase family protein [Putridiphycobacter roseus]PZE16200.1 thiol oxidoreductase [Putridiphycobacter roseus]